MTIVDASPATPRVASNHRLEIGDAERAELGSLARLLTYTPPGLLDDPSWLAQARALSCRLPVRLLEAVRLYRHDPGEDGTLLLTGLPIDADALPDTPHVPESVERVASVPTALAVLIGLQLGEIVSYRDEKAGALVQNVVPVRGLEGSQSNGGSVPLELHVENAFHPYRPDYVGLICVRNDHTRQAGTLFASIRQALPLLDEADRKVLHDARFVTAPPPSFRTGEHTRPQPVLLGSLDDPNICLDLNATVPMDDQAEQALDRLRAVLAEVASSLVLQSGEMAFVDNRIVLHGRTQFTPRYDGRDRWLHRVYVHLDNRRSRSHRVGNGPVLV